jgi:hypothetical protein
MLEKNLWKRDLLPEGIGSRDFYGVWGSDDKNILAVGDSGLILRHLVAVPGWGEAPQDWVVEEAPTTVGLRAVWGSGPKDTFAVGKNGTILHYDGTSWAPMESGTRADLLAVSGTASHDVFAVGASGTFSITTAGAGPCSPTKRRRISTASPSQFPAPPLSRARTRSSTARSENDQRSGTDLRPPR